MGHSPATTLFLDLETSTDGKRLLDIGAVLGIGELRTKRLSELEPWIQRAHYIVGHNLVRHDIPFLRSKIGDKEFAGKVLVDTLGWSALLFPDKPYHKLVKGYKLGGDEVENNPLSDSKICKQLLDELLGKFVGLSPGLKAIYWLLLCQAPGYGGFFHIAGYTPEVVGKNWTGSRRSLNS